MSRKLKIAHSLEELQDQVILTLKDRPILANGQIDEEVDVLQNDQIQINNQAKYNNELKSKLKNIANAASSHLQAKNQGITEILPHYNDYTYKPQTVDVEQGGVIKFKRNKKSKTLGADYLQSQVTTSKLNAQYITKSQNKKGAANGKKATQDLLNFLDQTAEDNKFQFKKEIDVNQIIQDSVNQIKKKRILDNQIKNIAQNNSIKLQDQEESLLLKSIERSRKKAEKERKDQKAFNVLESIKEQEEEDKEKEKYIKTVQIQMNPIAFKSTDKVRHMKNIQIKEAVSGTTSAMFVNLPSERLAKKTDTKKNQLPQSFQQLSKQQLQKMREQVKFLQDKEVGIGLAGTLQFLRQNALLGKQEQVGRYNDKQVVFNDPNDKIKLQYRNASGKLMKPKEAYRYICAKFHGEGPGKNKVQMRKRRQLEEIRMKERQNSGGQLLNLLEQHQEKSGEAHMVLNVGGKGQSRS